MLQFGRHIVTIWDDIRMVLWQVSCCSTISWSWLVSSRSCSSSGMAVVLTRRYWSSLIVMMFIVADLGQRKLFYRLGFEVSCFCNKMNKCTEKIFLSLNPEIFCITEKRTDPDPVKWCGFGRIRLLDHYLYQTCRLAIVGNILKCTVASWWAHTISSPSSTTSSPIQPGHLR